MSAKLKSPLSLFQPAQSTGELVKAFRENFGIAQDEMATNCKINQANLSAIENGTRLVGPSVALKLSAFMGLNPEVILFPAGYESEPEYQEVKAKLEHIRPEMSPSEEIEASDVSSEEDTSAASLERIISKGNLPRTQLLKKIWAYIRKQRLQGEVLELAAKDLRDLVKHSHHLNRSVGSRTRKTTKKASR